MKKLCVFEKKGVKHDKKNKTEKSQLFFYKKDAIVRKTKTNQSKKIEIK